MWKRIYEARLYNKTGIDTQPLPVTFMSADPFTVKKIDVDGFVEIYASGYDATVAGSSEDCFPLYSGQDSDSLAPIPFPTPLMTISSTSLFMIITVSMGIDTNLTLTAGQNSAILSPGYHGCGGTERYRYKETDDPINYVVSLNDFGKRGNFSLYADTLTGVNIPVLVTPSEGRALSSFTSPPVNQNASFAMRVGVKLNDPSAVPSSTKTPQPESTTNYATCMAKTIHLLIIGFFTTFLRR